MKNKQALNYMDRAGITAMMVEKIRAGASVESAMDSALEHFNDLCAELIENKTERAKKYYKIETARVWFAVGLAQIIADV